MNNEQAANQKEFERLREIIDRERSDRLELKRLLKLEQDNSAELQKRIDQVLELLGSRFELLGGD